MITKGTERLFYSMGVPSRSEVDKFNINEVVFIRDDYNRSNEIDTLRDYGLNIYQAPAVCSMADYSKDNFQKVIEHIVFGITMSESSNFLIVHLGGKRVNVMLVREVLRHCGLSSTQADKVIDMAAAPPPIPRPSR